MRRSLDETRIGEYKNNYFFEIIHLLLALMGIMIVFVLPMIFDTNKAIEMSNETLVSFQGKSIFEFIFRNNINSIQGIICICALIYFSIILIHSLLLIISYRLNKSKYVKISKIIDVVFSISFLGLLIYYMCMPISKMNYFDSGCQFYLISFVALIICVNFILMNSIFIFFTSKKSSIYD